MLAGNAYMLQKLRFILFLVPGSMVVSLVAILFLVLMVNSHALLSSSSSMLTREKKTGKSIKAKVRNDMCTFKREI